MGVVRFIPGRGVWWAAIRLPRWLVVAGPGLALAVLIAVVVAVVLLAVVVARWGRRSCQRYSGLDRQRASARQARVAGADRLQGATIREEAREGDAPGLRPLQDALDDLETTPGRRKAAN